MDANAKTGPSCEPIVFGKDDASSANTIFLCDFLVDRNLCLPSTSQLHQGPDHTWTAPDGIAQHRIDFVAIPQDEICFCTYSCTLDQFDHGNQHEDHQAVALQLQWIQDRVTPGKHSHMTCQLDRHAITGQERLIDMSYLQASPWNEDVETHVQAFNAAIHTTVKQSCSIRRQGKKKHYIPEEVWAWRSAKLHLRRRLQEARKQISRDSLRLVFWAWKHHQQVSDCIQPILSAHAGHANTTICLLFHLNCRYQTLARQIKRVQLAKELDSNCDKTAAGTLLQMLRPFIGSTNLKKQKKSGPPAVRQKDGSICRTPEEAQNR